jgi:hypothetical protein
MRNRLRNLLADWSLELPSAGPTEPGERSTAQPGGYGMPRGINMLMPVELCINRDLLVSLLSASIREIHRHKQALPEGCTSRDLAEVDAALQQQLAFRSWARSHPGGYISIAMYPRAETGPVEDLEDLGEF